MSDELEFSKGKQTAYKKRMKKKPAGDRKESTVQAAVNDHLKRKWIKYFRIPDWFWNWLHNHSGATAHVKTSVAESFAGWPDNMCFYPITDKYLLALPIECKSGKGRLSGSSQRKMADELSYQIPRSAEAGIKMVNEFEKDAERIKTIIVNAIGKRPVLQFNGYYFCGECGYNNPLVQGDDYYCSHCGAKIIWEE